MNNQDLLADLIALLEPETWTSVAAAIAAVTVRTFLAPAQSVRQTIGGVGAGLLSAVLLTDPVSQTLGMQTNAPLVAASIALIGERIVRKWMEVADSPGFFKGVLRKFGIRFDDDKGGDPR